MASLMQFVAQAVQQNIDWQALPLDMYDFVYLMSRCKQNPVWHGEGDVWTHTQMVCEKLVTLEHFQALSDTEKQAVFLAALLHDIGKISTTRWEDGHWTSPKHTIVGASMVRDFLWKKCGLCGTAEKQQFRETVCNLIRHHSFPPHALEREDNRRQLLSIAASGETCPMFTVNLLCVLCEADALGRVAADREQMAEQVLLCREFARENGCLDGPFPFLSPHSRYAYLSGRNIAPEMPLYDDTWGEVILLSGLPGTGKDTWIRENIPDLPEISLDKIRLDLGISPTENQSKVAEIARERAKEYLRKKQPFVWNATNLSPMLRSKEITLFSQYGAATRIIYLETSWEEQLRRNSSRFHAVPELTISEMLENLIPPEVKEAHRVQWLCV